MKFKYGYILFVLMCLLTVSSAMADIGDDLAPYLYAQYTFDNDRSDPQDSGRSASRHLSTQTGTHSFISSCLNNGCFGFDGTQALNMSTPYTNADGNQITIAAWVKVNNSVSSLAPVTYGDSDATAPFFVMGMGNPGADVYFIYYNDGGTANFDNSAVNTYSDWTLVGIQTDFSTQQMLLNGTEVVNEATSAQVNLNELEIASNTNGYARFHGLIDTVYIFNKTLNTSDWAYLNSSLGAPIGGGGSPVAVNYSWATPLNNTQYTSDSLNFTINVTQATFPVNLTLYRNGTSIINFTGISDTGQYNFSDNVTTSQEYHYNFYFIDNASQTATTENRTIYFDAVNPAIVSTWVNDTSVYNGSLTANFTFTDDFSLYSYTILVNGIVHDNGSQLLTTSFNYQLNITPTNLTTYGTNRTHTVTINISDGHTANAIPEYVFSRNIITNSLTYEFDNREVKVWPKSFNPFETFETEKKIDRYIWKHNRNSNRNTETYVIESDEDIVYIPDERLKGWFVIPKLNKWIDFENTVDSDVTVTKINNKRYEITLTNINQEDFEIHSIGDLNTVTQNFSFYAGSYTTNIITPVLETTDTAVNATFFINDSYISDVVANFSWNGTIYQADKTSNASEIFFTTSYTIPRVDANTSIDTFWNYHIIGVNGTNETNSTTLQTQTILDFSMYNCSSSDPDAALVFIPKLEVNNTNENNTEVDITLETWIDQATRFNQSWQNRNQLNYTICLNPFNQTWNVNGFIDYEKTGYSQRNYFLYDTTIGVTKQEIPLYLIESSDDTDVNIEVTNIDDDVIDSAYIKVLRYFAETNTFRTVEIARTDINGKTVARLILNDVWYKFIIQKDNSTLFTSNTSKVLTSDLFFQVKNVDRWTTTLANIDTIDYNFTYDNTTGNFLFVYSDTTNIVRKGCVKVLKKMATGDQQQCYSCETSTAASITCNINPNTSGVYIGQAYIDTNTANSEFPIEQIEAYLKNDFTTFGWRGLMIALMLIGVLVGLGMWKAEVALIFTIIGLIAASILDLIGLTYQVIITLIVAIMFFIITRKT